MVELHVYHPDQELHQHVHESKQSAVHTIISSNTSSKDGGL